ncbi:MAG TPA: fibronectin type III-like domain-contianing protein, partial [Chthonomonas sp.]|uniref:fibronectin type III-like domain-contianing protein n=1 Tax=Chthonomonas sp. TaxID=2282153 RepID=UPI002B4AD317
SPVKRPNKQLVDFKRVELRPGETKRVELSLPYESPALWYWDADRSKFMLQPGTATLMVGNSSAHIAHASTIELA